MIRGDVYLGGQFGGNVLNWKKEGAPLEFVIPREGLIAFPNYFVIAKGCSPVQKPPSVFPRGVRSPTAGVPPILL